MAESSATRRARKTLQPIGAIDDRGVAQLFGDALQRARE